MCYSIKGSLYKILDLLRGNNYFSYNFLNSYAIFKEEDIIHSENIVNMLNNLMKKELAICPRCGYYVKGIIINLSNPTIYRIIHEKVGQKINFFPEFFRDFRISFPNCGFSFQICGFLLILGIRKIYNNFKISFQIKNFILNFLSYY